MYAAQFYHGHTASLHFFSAHRDLCCVHCETASKVDAHRSRPMLAVGVAATVASLMPCCMQCQISIHFHLLISTILRGPAAAVWGGPSSRLRDRTLNRHYSEPNSTINTTDAARSRFYTPLRRRTKPIEPSPCVSYPNMSAD